MKVVLEEEKNKMSNKLKIFYISIIVICIIAIISAIVIEINKDKEQKQGKLPQIGTEEEISDAKEKFNEIFQNKVNYDIESNGYKITKTVEEEEIVYTGYQVQEKKINDYDVNVSIPYINIENTVTQEFNKKIIDIFEKKAKSVLNSKNGDVIYTVNYSAYVSNNILSLVVRSTLKEGNNPQRDIVQTYNYDLTNQKEYTIQDILDAKGITKREANQKIKEEITKVQKNVEELAQLGYSIYSRDPESDMYSINNVTEYFIGENNALYIIYAYGNENNTSEMDIIVM